MIIYVNLYFVNINYFYFIALYFYLFIFYIFMNLFYFFYYLLTKNVFSYHLTISKLLITIKFQYAMIQVPKAIFIFFVYSILLRNNFNREYIFRLNS